MICVDLAGRKILIVISCFGATFGFIGMGLYDLFKVNLQAHSWLMLVSFAFVILSASIGMIPIVYVLMTEVLPKKVHFTQLLLAPYKFNPISNTKNTYFATISLVPSDKKYHKFDKLSVAVGIVVCTVTLLSIVIRAIWHV